MTLENKVRRFIRFSSQKDRMTFHADYKASMEAFKAEYSTPGQRQGIRKEYVIAFILNYLQKEYRYEMRLPDTRETE